MSGLKVADSLKLPLDVVTETFGILAVRGAGKSNTAAVMAEEMFHAKLPFVAVDPARAWWGLRSSKDGKGPGLAIPIFGGRRGDAPLERGSGALIADLVAEQRLSCVLDISDFPSEQARKQFLLDFATRLYQKNEAPLHLFLEEADDYIPQKPMRDEAALLRAWENIVRRGRNRGLGCTLITQRSAVLNKNVLTQVQTLIAMRTTGPNDVAAIAAWLKYHRQSEEILASLSSLEDGEAWIWSPHFLRKTLRVRVRLRETFDSGATPKIAAATRAPATLADVDLDEIQKRMAVTIERAKAEDPQALRAEIVALQAKLRDAQRPAPVVKERRVEVAVVKPSEFTRAEALIARAVQVAERLSVLQQAFGSEASQLASALATAKPLEGVVRTQQPGTAARGRLERLRLIKQEPGDDAVGSGGLRRILVALAQRPQGLTLRQIGVRAGLSSRSGTFSTYMSRARQCGWVADRGGVTTVTTAGLAALGYYDPLPEGRELLDYWLRELGDSGAARILRAVADAYPKTLSLDEVGERAALSPRSGTFSTYLSRLRTLELIEGRGDVRASAELFA